jgi:hypothetical protein
MNSSLRVIKILDLVKELARGFTINKYSQEDDRIISMLKESKNLIIKKKNPICNVTYYLGPGQVDHIF